MNWSSPSGSDVEGRPQQPEDSTLPEIVNSLIDDRFASARESLIEVVREKIGEVDDELRPVSTWLDADFSEQFVRELIQRRFEDRRKRDRGQLSLPDGPSRHDKQATGLTNAGDQLRVDRLEAAFESLCAQNHVGNALRLLGSNIPNTERQENARRMVIVSACIVDPDASEYLATVTPLSKAPWRSDSSTVPKIRGRSELLSRWGWRAIEMLVEACDVLGWGTKPCSPCTIPVNDDPLNREQLKSALQVAQDRWPTLLDVLAYLSQRHDVLPLKPDDKARERGVTANVDAPFALAMRRVWQRLGLSTPRNGVELWDYVFAYAHGKINDSKVNRIVAPALRSLDTPEVRRSLWLAVLNEFPHIGRDLLTDDDCNSTGREAEAESRDVNSERTRMPLDEANVKAREYLRVNPCATAREVATSVGCALGQIPKLPAWRAVREARQKGRQPKTIALTQDLEQNIDQDGHIGRRIGTSPTARNTQLDKLISEHELDCEPSPLDDAPTPPISTRRKT